MKKLTCIIVLLLVSFQSVMANSTPTYWQGDNLGEVLIMDENVDIAVVNENIIFDFTDKTISTGSYWLTGKVDVVYQMHNPTSQATNVEMVFPFIELYRSYIFSPFVRPFLHCPTDNNKTNKRTRQPCVW